MPLPKSYAGISGFDRLSLSELAKHRWYPFEADDAPDCDKRKAQVVTRLSLRSGVVRAVHEVVPLSESECYHELAEHRRSLLSLLPSIRFRHEQDGTTSEGVPLHTDRDSYTAIALAAEGGRQERWKGADGKWYDMTPDQLKDAASAVSEYRRACFAREEVLEEKIRGANTLEALDAIDMEAGWPSK